MQLKSVDGFQYVTCGCTKPQAPCIYYMGLPQELSATEKLFAGLNCTIVYVVISDWDNMLTPWPAKGLYHGDPDFKGEAPQFLHTLLDELIPAIEQAENLSPQKRAIAGYSLAGLFAVYAFANCDTFSCVGTMSGSFWYEGWVDYITSLKLSRQGCSAFVSLGDKERKAREKILHSVQKNTDITIQALESWGVKVQHHLVPGGHFDNVEQRVQEGLTALAVMLSDVRQEIVRRSPQS